MLQTTSFNEIYANAPLTSKQQLGELLRSEKTTHKNSPLSVISLYIFFLYSL